MGGCLSNRSKKSNKEFVIRYDPSSSTTLYKQKRSGIISYFKNKFGRSNRQYIEVINIDTNIYKDITNDKIRYGFY
tara:strand:- start:156 stop:383 length:228 start_codon:yes stop_codon:yes gene_type:complete